MVSISAPWQPSNKYLKQGPRGLCGPMRVYLECIQINERLGAEFGHRFLKLRMEDIDKEVVKKRGQSAHGNIRVWWYEIFQSLEEPERWRKQYVYIEDTRVDE